MPQKELKIMILRELQGDGRKYSSEKREKSTPGAKEKLSQDKEMSF